MIQMMRKARIQHLILSLSFNLSLSLTLLILLSLLHKPLLSFSLGRHLLLHSIS
jgi:hypothetical protein